MILYDAPSTKDSVFGDIYHMRLAFAVELHASGDYIVAIIQSEDTAHICARQYLQVRAVENREEIALGERA